MIETRTLDVVVIIGYFLGITGLGIFFGKYTRSTKDFFFGGQRFSWWMIAMSCIATVVGSYSFIKYSAVGYTHGLSSTMTYLNDWFIVPFFILGWLPIIYFNRIFSIPEYFEKRFDRKTKIAAIVIIIIYMIGYVGINYYTLGVALQPILKIDLYLVVIIVAILGALYMHAGGQTSVIMTDIIQGFILLTAGFIMFFLCWDYIGGLDKLWSGLPESHQQPFSGLNKPADFNHAGIFWQDAFASSVAFWFMSQGTIMRFLSAKSPREGRKAMFAIILVLMPLAAFALANTGWFGKAMVTHGMLPESVPAKDIFVHVASKVAAPGVFGFVLAALTAALMSTIDTLINAISAIFVNDIYKPYVKKDAPDKHYLFTAQMVAIAAAVVGVMLVPIFASFKSIYSAHGIFIATVTPPMVLVIMLSVFWKRLTPNAAFYTIILGSLAMVVASIYPEIISVVDHGIDPSNGYKFIRAFFGLLASGVVAVVITLFTKSRDPDSIKGLVIDSVDAAKIAFKGGEPNDEEYEAPIELGLRTFSHTEADAVALSPAAMQAIKARPGDLVFVEDARWYNGGLRSGQGRLIEGPADDENVYITEEFLEASQLDINKPVKVEKIL